MKNLLFILISGILFSQNLTPFQKDSLWGYQNDKSKIIIEPQYEYAGYFVNDFAVVYKNDSAGLINKKNEIIFPFKFNKLRQDTPELFVYGYRTKYFGDFLNGLININDEEVTPPIYSEIYFDKNRFFVNQRKDSIISKEADSDLLQVQVKNNYGMLDENGKVLIPAKYDWMEFVDKDLISVSVNEGSLEGLFDINGKQIAELKYMLIGQFYDGFSNVRKEDEYGYIDRNGKEFLMGKYEDIYPFYKGKAIVSKKRGDKIYYMIDTKGNVIRTIKTDYEKLKKILQKDNLEIMVDEFRFMNRTE